MMVALQIWMRGRINQGVANYGALDHCFCPSPLVPLLMLHDESDCFALMISTVELSTNERITMVGTPVSRGQETLAAQLNPSGLLVTAKVPFMPPPS
jgi:hypothetical protein